MEFFLHKINKHHYESSKLFHHIQTSLAQSSSCRLVSNRTSISSYWAWSCCFSSKTTSPYSAAWTFSCVVCSSSLLSLVISCFSSAIKVSASPASDILARRRPVANDGRFSDGLMCIKVSSGEPPYLIYAR